MKFRISYLSFEYSPCSISDSMTALIALLHGISLNVITVKVNFFSLNSLINIGRSKRGARAII